MKALITGALGHIGSRLIHGIRPGEFDEVVLLDNLSTQRYCSLFNLPEGVPFRFVEDDVCSADLERFASGKDIVIHLAAITDATRSFEIADQVWRVNFKGTQRVARACAACGCRLVFISTTSVYGTQAELVGEECNPSDLKPQSPYAESKLKAEEFLRALGREGRLRFAICRFGTIFWASIGMRFHTAINKLVWQACRGEPLTVWRAAMDQKRPYLDLGDAVRALQFIIATDRFDNRVYNILTKNCTVREIVDIIREYIPDTVIERVDSRIMNQLSYEVSCERFTSLGFEFRGNLREGIGEIVRLITGARRVNA
jgi:UDP-glucose 4-epimerase